MVVSCSPGILYLNFFLFGFLSPKHFWPFCLILSCFGPVFARYASGFLLSAAGARREKVATLETSLYSAPLLVDETMTLKFLSYWRSCTWGSRMLFLESLWGEFHFLRLGILLSEWGVETTVGAGEMQNTGVSPIAFRHLVLILEYSSTSQYSTVFRCANSWGDCRIFCFLFFPFHSLPPSSAR